MFSKILIRFTTTALLAGFVALGFANPASATATLTVTPSDGVVPSGVTSDDLVIALSNLPSDATNFVFNISGVTNPSSNITRTADPFSGGVFTACRFQSVSFKPANTTTAGCSLTQTQYTFTPATPGGAGTSLEVYIDFVSYAASGPYTIEAVYTSGGSSVSQTVTLTEKASSSATVIFDSNGGSGTAMADQTASSATILTKNTYTRTGYTFAGWATTSTGTVAYADEAEYAFTSSATLYAVWEAQGAAITDFRAVAGSPINTVESNGSPISFSGTTVTAGVKGIVIAAALGTPGFPFSSLGACPTWVEYVQLKTPDNSFQVNCYASGNKLRLFRADGNTLPAGTQFTVRIASQTITFSAGITMSLYTTAGMQFDDVAIDTASTTIVWPQTVKFLADGGTGTMNDQVSVGAANLDPNKFTKSGYTFAGWIDYANGSKVYADEAEYPFTNTFTGVTNLTAKWVAATPSSFTVSFNANGGIGNMADQTASSATNLTSNTFTKTGFTFEGWNTNADGSGVSYGNGASYPFTSSTTLYAQWTAAAPTGYTVTFNANGGSGVMLNQSATTPTALTTNTFIRSGYSFAGWNTNVDGSGVSYGNGASYPFTSSATLYAQWTADSSSPTPTATVSLGVPVGGFIPGSTTAINANGLQPTAPFDVVLRSTPQTLASGVAVSGAVNTSVTMPTGIEPGWHSLTFSSVAADGTSFSQVLYFLVSDSSTLVATSTTPPSNLASTGSAAPGTLGNASFVLLLGAGLIGLSLLRRKKLQ